MRIDVYVHIIDGNVIDDKLGKKILGKLNALQREEVHLMKEVDDLIVEVAAIQGEAESTEAAIDSILIYIQQILDKISNTVDPVVIKGLTDQLATYRAALATKKQALLDAIAANPAP